jgi:hypothetical protein
MSKEDLDIVSKSSMREFKDTLNGEGNYKLAVAFLQKLFQELLSLYLTTLEVSFCLFPY